MEKNLNSQSNTLPIVNGILYSNGHIERYVITADENWYRTVSKDNAVSEISPENIIETAACINDEYVCAEIDIKFTCGEGSYGGDGFILAETNKSNQMVWLISFDDANPFVKLEKKGNFLFSINNCGEVWCINITDIYNIEISIEKQSRYVV